MKQKKIKIQAAADAPDEVSQGNLRAVKHDGYYETDHERFAAFLEANYGARPQAKTDDADSTAKKRGEK